MACFTTSARRASSDVGLLGSEPHCHSQSSAAEGSLKGGRQGPASSPGVGGQESFGRSGTGPSSHVWGLREDASRRRLHHDFIGKSLLLLHRASKASLNFKGPTKDLK